MRKQLLLLMVVLSCTMTFAAEEILLSGDVLNGIHQPIVGAVVTIKGKPEYSAVTNESGQFTIASTHVRTSFITHSGKQSFAFLQGNRLMITPTAQSIALELFACNGQRLFAYSIDNISDQSQNVKLPQLSTGFYLLKVTVDNKTATFNQIFSSHQTLTVQKNSLLSSTPKTLTKISASPDTLIAVAAGHLVAALEIAAYNATDLEVTMTISSQYQPTGESDHDGSMVKINAKDRNFSMGQPILLPNKSASDYWDIEAPVHTVAFSYDFWMDTTEVTQKMFGDIMTAGYEDYSAPGWSNTYGLGDNIPSYLVNKYDAILFCNARSKAEGLDTVYMFSSIVGSPGALSTCKDMAMDFSKNGYRLPTEAEWEYACRGGTVTDYYWNKMYRPYPVTPEDTAEISTYALWGANSFHPGADEPGYAMRLGVASKLPNGYGLYDMIGSCSEFFHVPAAYEQYTTEECVDPKPTPAPADTAIYSRGGNWGNDARYIRSSSRPSSEANYPYFFRGFRTVKEDQ